MSEQTWVVVGSYEVSEGEWVCEVMGRGFATEAEAKAAAEWMTDNAPDINFEWDTAEAAAQVVTQ